MYRELLAIDLPTVVKVAQSKSLDIRLAKERVNASRGAYQGATGAIFPVISPGLSFTHVGGTSQAVDGSLVNTTFNTLVPAATVQWIVNPGRVVYDIVAARRRVEAAEQQEHAAELESTRLAAVQYYDLVLTQAQVAVARQSVAGAEESLRLAEARLRSGTGLRAEDLRARAFLAARRQDLLLAVNAFYQASVALTVTLRIDPTTTLVPAATELPQTTLVREDLPIERLLATAVEYRPDLAAARTLLAAAKADRKAALWTAFGPNLQAAYSVGALATRHNDDTTGFHRTERGTVGAGTNFGAGTYAQTRIAAADARTAAIQVERRLDEIRAQVVANQQASLTHAALIPIARQQFESAEEALRLTRANQQAGTMLLTDVLTTQDQLDNARLRHVEAVARYNQSQINLLASLGLPTPATPSPTTRPTTVPAIE
jgi:outer membrane protein TolC